MKTEVEIGGMRPQTKGLLEPPEAGRGLSGVFPQRFVHLEPGMGPYLETEPLQM